MTDTVARIKKNGKHFEILVDLDEAMKVRKGSGNLSVAILTNAIFHNLKSGEHVSEGELREAFGSEDFLTVAEKIIKSGEVVRTTE